MDSPTYYLIVCCAVLALLVPAVPGIIFFSKSEYFKVMERTLAKHPKSFMIDFCVFEGSLSRNPNAWTLHDTWVQRKDDAAICVFDWKDYKKYVALRKQINAEEKRKANNDELQHVRQLKAQFVQSPAQYLEAHEEPIELNFKPAQKEYAVLQRNVEQYRRSSMYDRIIDDYNGRQYRK